MKVVRIIPVWNSLLKTTTPRSAIASWAMKKPLRLALAGSNLARFAADILAASDAAPAQNTIQGTR